MIKSFNFLKCALLADIKSIIGTTCSCKESGKVSHSHNVALNFCVFVVWSIGRPISRVPSSTRLLKYSSGVIWLGLLDDLAFSWKIRKQNELCIWASMSKTNYFEPCHEIMALFVLQKLILQTRMRSHPVGLDVWFLVGPFVYFHILCVQTAKALMSRLAWAFAGSLCDKYQNLMSWLICLTTGCTCSCI